MKIWNKETAISQMIKRLGLETYGFAYRFDENREQNGLTLQKDKKEVSICFSERAYLFRALGLLKERCNEDQFVLSENASFTMNGIMLDCSRNAVPRIDTIKEILCQLALMGHNTILLYTEDTYELENNPYFGYMRGRYTIQELREIDDFADMLGIELIPCIQTLGHMGQVLKWSRVYGDIEDVGNVLLIDSDRTYQFIEEMLTACRKAFRSKRIHIGMDEAHMMGRGKYYDKHGDFLKTELFLRHLDRVGRLCEQYDFRPMFWGDMLLRQVGCYGYTDCDVDLSKLSVHFQIPETIDYIYWDYYSNTPERYRDFIKIHQKSSNHVMFFGGAWRWSNFVAGLKYSNDVSAMALAECKKAGIREVIDTMWGDDGNESSFFISWPCAQLYAELNFYDHVDDKRLSKRFNTCTGMIYEDFVIAEKINNPCGITTRKEDNPPKYLLYQDISMGLFDYYVKPGFNAYYVGLAEELRSCAAHNEKTEYIFSNLAALCDVLAVKSELGVQLKAAYDAGDKAFLKKTADTILPELCEKLTAFRNTFYRQWITENKIIGYEVMDLRLGGVLQRAKTVRERLQDYCDGKLTVLEEFCEERLPFDGQSDVSAVQSYWGNSVTTGY